MISWGGWHIALSLDTNANRGHSSQFRVKSEGLEWKNCGRVPTVREPKFRERTPRETLHLVESMACFSPKLGSCLGTWRCELGRLFFGVELPISAFIDSEIRFVFASALSNFNLLNICADQRLEVSKAGRITHAAYGIRAKVLRGQTSGDLPFGREHGELFAQTRLRFGSRLR